MPYRPQPIIAPPADMRLGKLARMTSSVEGLSSLLLLVEYSSPWVVTLIMSLARLRGKLGFRGAGSSARVAQGWKDVAMSASEAQILLRLAGESYLIPRPSAIR